MRPPLDVTRTLADRAYFPLERDDFGQNHLAARVRPYGEPPEKRFFASLCAVPRGAPRDRITSIEEFNKWLDPVQRVYEQKAIWIPGRRGGYGRTFTSQGLLRIDDHEYGWESFLHVGFDGYIEYGRLAGRQHEYGRFFWYAPMVQWIQRFAGFCLDARGVYNPVPQFWLVLNITDASAASLGALGKGWREPWDGWGREFPGAIEKNIQIHRALTEADNPVEIAHWFAERIGAGFGMDKPRCYNTQGDNVGGLPGGDF